MIVYHNCSLSHLFFALDFGLGRLLLGLYCRCRGLISKNIVFLLGTWTWFVAWIIFFVAVIIVEHIVIFNNFDGHLVFILFDFCHEAHINKSVQLTFLVIRPDQFVFRVLIKRRTVFFLCLKTLWSSGRDFFFYLLALFVFNFILFFFLFLSFLSVVIFQKLLFVRFIIWKSVYGLSLQVPFNFVDHIARNLFALHITVHIIICIPVGVWRTYHWFWLSARLFESLEEFSAKKDEGIIEDLVGLFFRDFAFLIEEFRVSFEEFLNGGW